jgi:hypothetical protein
MVALTNSEKQEQPMTAFHPVIQELRQMVEEDADLYMGFRQMFEQIPSDPKYDANPLGRLQVGAISLTKDKSQQIKAICRSEITGTCSKCLTQFSLTLPNSSVGP